MRNHFSVPALAGNTLFSCFFSKDAPAGKETAFTEEHSHANFELLFIQEGSGIQFIRNVAHEFSPGDVFLFAPFTPHASVCPSGQRQRRISLRFAVRERMLLPGEGSGDRAVSWLQETGFYFFRAEKTLQDLLTVLEEKQEESAAHSGIMSAILSLAVEKITRQLDPADELFKNSASDEGMDRRFLIDNFFDQLVNRNSTVEELCQQVHLSPAQLNRVIKEMFGMPFKQKLTQVRLAYIKDFLRFSDLSIHEIAQRNGFSDTANFSLFFKKHVGMSPSRFRQQERV